MKIDTTEKYSDIFKRMLSLFPVFETALEDDVESEEFKQFMVKDLDNLYNHVEEVKEYVDSIPVKKKSFCKIDYPDKILTFIYSELIKLESTGEIKGVPMSKNFIHSIKGILFLIFFYILMNRWTFTNETEILNLVEFITIIW